MEIRFSTTRQELGRALRGLQASGQDLGGAAEVRLVSQDDGIWLSLGTCSVRIRGRMSGGRGLVLPDDTLRTIHRWALGRGEEVEVVVVPGRATYGPWTFIEPGIHVRDDLPVPGSGAASAGEAQSITERCRAAGIKGRPTWRDAYKLLRGVDDGVPFEEAALRERQQQLQRAFDRALGSLEKLGVTRDTLLRVLDESTGVRAASPAGGRRAVPARGRARIAPSDQEVLRALADLLRQALRSPPLTGRELLALARMLASLDDLPLLPEFCATLQLTRSAVQLPTEWTVEWWSFEFDRAWVAFRAGADHWLPERGVEPTTAFEWVVREAGAASARPRRPARAFAAERARFLSEMAALRLDAGDFDVAVEEFD